MVETNQIHLRVPDIITFVEHDSRSMEEIFASIKNRIQLRNANSLTDKEAIQATRRLIGFFKLSVDSAHTASDKIDF